MRKRKVIGILLSIFLIVFLGFTLGYVVYQLKYPKFTETAETSGNSNQSKLKAQKERIEKAAQEEKEKQKAEEQQKEEEIPVETPTPTPTKEPTIFSEVPESFIFASGVGAWGTELVIDENGSFTGSYHDSDMGPTPTVYYNNFYGKFTEPVQVDEYTYYFTMEELTSEDEVGLTYEKDGMQYICTQPYGLEKAKDMWLYLPGTPVEKLPGTELGLLLIQSADAGKVLSPGTYLIYNSAEQIGFIGTEDYADLLVYP